MIYTITVAFCPASQFARSILEYRKHRSIKPDRHIVVQGHYPINRAKNNRDIAMLCQSLGDLELWDPGQDLGSAQSQWWALVQLGLTDKDFWINLDPDSSCPTPNWDKKLRGILENDPHCIVASCMSPMVREFIKARGMHLEVDLHNSYGIARSPCPFNLSMWRYSFFQSIGGIPQLGEFWGEVEGATFGYAKAMGKHHGYALDVLEDESGKFMQDRQLLEFKDLNMRTMGPDKFLGRYLEYLAYRYPGLENLTTLIPEGTIFK